ncbi:uncharacterized protein LODBEIA_P32270 [Lodderomyces beijingensis]|uniref:Histone transcription regulator 3 homolog n=1 Tax=Lodderomyces beijingensis TaxID=1775926 RepID=A0ABP0ZMV7_9ASCO
MSAFRPLNVIEDQSTKRDLEEEHTRELQVEQAFEIFHRALRLQKEQNHEQAYKSYEELFAIDIIANHYFEEVDCIKGLQNGSANSITDQLSSLSQSVKTLRYLVFRNRGVLYWTMLKSEDVPKAPAEAEIAWEQKSKSLFYTMVDDFCIALLYGEADEKLLDILYQVFTFVGSLKLARGVLEYTASSRSESDDLSGLLPLDSVDKVRLKKLRAALSYSKTKRENTNGAAIKPLQAYPALKRIKNEFEILALQRGFKNTLNIKITSAGKSLVWLDVLETLDAVVEESQDETKIEDVSKLKLRHFDPYQLSESPVDRTTIDVEALVDASFSKSPQIVDTTEESDLLEKQTNIDPNAKKNEEESEKLEDPKKSKESKESEEQKKPEEQKESEEPKELRELQNIEVEQSGPQQFTEINEQKRQQQQQQLHRASKRLARVEAESVSSAIVVEKHHFAGLDYFIKKLSGLLGGEFRIGDISSMYFQQVEDSKSSYAIDFLQMARGWKKSYTTALQSFTSVNTKSSNDNVKLLELLNKFSNKMETDSQTSVLPQLNDVEENELILSVITGNYDYMGLKSRILKHLFGSKSQLHLCSKWTTEMYSKAAAWIHQIDHFLLQSLQGTIDDMAFAVSVCEVLVDDSINMRSQIKDLLSLKKINKAAVNAMCQDLLRLNDKIQRWLNFVTEGLASTTAREKDDDSESWFHLYTRFSWCKIVLLKSQTTSWNEDRIVKASLQELLQRVKANSYSLEISYPNYSNFPVLSTENIKTQLMVVSVLAIFSQIIFASPSDDNTNAIKLLEDILMDSDREKDEAILSIKSFLQSNSVDLSLSLWNILLQFYKSAGLYDEFVDAFVASLRVFNSYMKSEKYQLADTSNRLDSMCRIVGFYNHGLRLVVEILEQNDWRLQKKSIPFDVIEPLFEICLLFEIHEEASSISSLNTSIRETSAQAYDLLKEMFLKATVLILANIRESREPQILHEAVKLFHAQLGASGICDSAGGIFLKASQEYLNNIENAEKDISQLIKCRYHYTIALDDFTPFEHDTQEKETLSVAGCEDLARFVLPLCFATNTVKNAPKQDMKILIEEMYEVIGDPDFEKDHILNRNKACMEHFLDTTRLTPRFIRNAFYGLVQIDLDETESKIAASGLYYLQGLLIFSSYKLRKKNMQGRAVEIENAISLFTYDLIYGSNRLESWLLMAQAYGYLVEDDLIWTSDKLTVFDRKIGTANLQRKSLICYLMAINCIQEDANQQKLKPIVAMLMSSFAKALFGAIMPPMDMLAFRVQCQPRFINGPSGASFSNAAESPASSKSFCLRIAKQSFHLALKSGEKSWTDYYYLSKVQRKSGDSPKLVLETMNKSCKVAASLKVPETIIEPHYCMISLCLKYVKSRQLSTAAAYKYLRKNPILHLDNFAASFKDDGDIDHDDFIGIIVTALHQVDAADRKNWQHKAKFKLSRVLFEEKGDIDGAMKIMSDFISLKSTNKQLVSIWKPEFERPGKHFIYTYQYIRFYIELLDRKRDVNSLIMMMPKLRRSSSIMVNLYNAWELLCSLTSKLIRSAFGLGDSFAFTDGYINGLPFSTFSSNTRSMLETLQKSGVPKELEFHLCLLFALNDMRKLNNGYGPTSLIDDTVISMFFKIYEHFNKGNHFQATLASPNPKRKIARKDIFPFTTEIVKHSRRDVEEMIKNDPEIYNHILEQLLLEQNSTTEQNGGDSEKFPESLEDENDETCLASVAHESPSTPPNESVAADREVVAQTPPTNIVDNDDKDENDKDEDHKDKDKDKDKDKEEVQTLDKKSNELKSAENTGSNDSESLKVSELIDAENQNENQNENTGEAIAKEGQLNGDELPLNKVEGNEPSGRESDSTKENSRKRSSETIAERPACRTSAFNSTGDHITIIISDSDEEQDSDPITIKKRKKSS